MYVILHRLKGNENAYMALGDNGQMLYWSEEFDAHTWARNTFTDRPMAEEWKIANVFDLWGVLSKLPVHDITTSVRTD